jgi:hypothetical protein
MEWRRLRANEQLDLAVYARAALFHAQHQGEKGAEDVPANGGVGSMEDRPCRQQRLGREEALLHRQQVAVPQDHLQGCQPGVGAQHEEAIETGISIDFRSIDSEPFGCGISQEAAVSGIADQRLITLRELAFETVQQCGPGLGILAGLFLIAAQHVARPARTMSLMARSVSPFWRGMVSGTATPSSSTTGSSVVTSAVLPGQRNEAIGRSWPSSTMPNTPGATAAGSP